MEHLERSWLSRVSMLGVLLLTTHCVRCISTNLCQHMISCHQSHDNHQADAVFQQGSKPCNAALMHRRD